MMALTQGGSTMKVTVILAGILAVNLVAVAQQPDVITPAQTNQAASATTLPTVVRPQPTTGTNQTSGGSATNVPSAATSSTNANNTANSSHPVTIIRGTDTSTTTGNSSSQPPPKNNDGVDPIKSTAGTPDDWRSGNSVPHVVPPRDSGANP
jgi:hypothetical protein